MNQRLRLSPPFFWPWVSALLFGLRVFLTADVRLSFLFFFLPILTEYPFVLFSFRSVISLFSLGIPRAFPTPSVRSFTPLYVLYR